MSSVEEVKNLVDGLGKQFPDGLAMGLHIEAYKPKFVFQTYSREWLDVYNREGLFQKDPTVKYGLFHETSTARWSNFPEEYDLALFERSAEYGLKYGFTVVYSADGTKSIGSAASSHREFLDEEISLFEQEFKKIHDMTASTRLLPDEAAILQQVAVSMTH